MTPSTPSTTALLRAHRVHVAFPGRRGAPDARAVDGVDLDIRRGEIVALVGESGCGKTTLARTLLGLVAPTEGGVTFDGRPLEYSGRSLKAYRKRVQLVLQDPSGSLNPGTRCTTRSPRDCASTVTAVTNRRRWPGRCPGPGCGRRSASSCAIRTSCPAVSVSGW